MSFDASKIVKYWKEHADYDIETAESMFDAKRYPYALFMCHLSIEKLLKALYVKEYGEHAPYVHNLVELAKKLNLNFVDDQKKLLADLSSFNLEARYPEWKSVFYKTATKAYTKKYLENTKNFYLWLKKYLKK
jgi:AbiV family abortive infection protein